MKFTLVRFKEDKRPVCVLGGHLGELDVFCAIDEWYDPMKCEYTYVEISKYCFSWCWYGGVKTFKEKRNTVVGDDEEIDNSYSYNGDVEFGSLLLMELTNYFEPEDGFDIEWMQVTKIY